MNPAGQQLRIVSGGPPYVFTLDPANSSGLAHSFRIANDTSALSGGPPTDYWGAPEYVFEAKQTLYVERVLTLRSWVEFGWPLQPGRYRLRAYYNGREGTGADFTFAP